MTLCWTSKVNLSNVVREFTNITAFNRCLSRPLLMTLMEQMLPRSRYLLNLKNHKLLKFHMPISGLPFVLERCYTSITCQSAFASKTIVLTYRILSESPVYAALQIMPPVHVRDIIEFLLEIEEDGKKTNHIDISIIDLY